MIRTGGAGQYLALDRGREVPGSYRDVVADHPVEPAVLALVGS